MNAGISELRKNAEHMIQFNELNKIDSTPKIDWKKVSLEKLRKSLDADIELRSNIRKTMSPAKMDNQPDKLHNFI